MNIANNASASRRLEAIPPHAFFVVSAVFHYLGPAFAVLLFRHVEALGVAWLRIATAALAFALWRRPWRTLRAASWSERRLLVAMGVILAAMNSVFYLAIAHLPLATVGAVEFLAPIALAAAGVRDRRNTIALALAVAGISMLMRIRFEGDHLAWLFAFANCVLFAGYITAGHALARNGGVSGIDRLGAAMLLAAVAAMPIGLRDALPAFEDARWLFAAIGVGLSSSVIPYVCDQLAMARMPRSTFALMLALLPAIACLMGALVLGQVPTTVEMNGIALVIVGVSLHRSAAAA